MNKDDFENLTEEEKARRGMALLGILGLEAIKNSQTADPVETLAKTNKELYDAYIKAGFTPDQAMDLVKSLNYAMSPRR